MKNVPQQSNEPTLPLEYPFPLGENGTPPSVIHWARKYHPICPVRLPSGHQVWMITRKDDIETVLKDSRFSRNLAFSGAPRMAGEDFTTIPGGIFNLDPPDHNRVRRVLKNFYTPTGVERYRPIVEKHATQLLDAMEQRLNPTDFMEAYAGILPLQVSSDILHIPIEHRNMYLQYFQTQTDLSADKKAISDATHRVKEFAQAIIETKISSNKINSDEPIGALICAQKDGIIREAEVLGTVCYLLITGSEPLVAPLGTGTLTLMLHRNQLRECIKNPDLWPQAVEEILRYHHNGVLGLPRVALEDVPMHNMVIRKNEAVCIPMLGATWDPRHYPNPHKFNIHRTTDSSITFGHGPHFCLGASLSRMFLQVAFSMLFTRFPDLFLAIPEREIPWDGATIFIKPCSLPVSW